MQWVIVTGFLVTLVRFGGGKVPPTPILELHSTHSETPQVECLAGSEWESNCHFCHCTESGVAQCLKQNTCIERISADPIHCRPNTTFRNDCNTCICPDEGRPLCTRKLCLKITSGDMKEESNSEDEAEELGPPVDEWKGKESENKRDEKEPSLVYRNLVKRSVCKPNQDFQNECNSCKCSPDGQRFTCTQNECLEKDMNKEVEVFMESEGEDHIEKHSVCRPHDTFTIGCNTCDCNYDGTDYSCTNKACPLPKDVELFHELRITKSSINNTKEVICAANRMFVKDCNTCWCNDDGTSYFCTRKVCVLELPDEPNIEEEKPEELRIIKKECRPNEVFELECNMCRCNPDGKSFSCTRRACVDQEDVKNLTTLSRRVRATNSEKLKVCTPREEFRLDCNTCLCDDEGQSFSCTRIDCYKSSSRKKRVMDDESDVKKKGQRYTIKYQGAECASDLQRITLTCAAGSVFDRDCNTCRCTDDGEHAMCTNKNCQTTTKGPEPEKGSNDGGVHNTESDPGFRCNPGEQFKRDCKDCTCSADGKSYFCTLRLCDEFIVPGI